MSGVTGNRGYDPRVSMNEALNAAGLPQVKTPGRVRSDAAAPPRLEPRAALPPSAKVPPSSSPATAQIQQQKKGFLSKLADKIIGQNPSQIQMPESLMIKNVGDTTSEVRTITKLCPNLSKHDAAAIGENQMNTHLQPWIDDLQSIKTTNPARLNEIKSFDDLKTLIHNNKERTLDSLVKLNPPNKALFFSFTPQCQNHIIAGLQNAPRESLGNFTSVKSFVSLVPPQSQYEIQNKLDSEELKEQEAPTQTTSTGSVSIPKSTNYTEFATELLGTKFDSLARVLLAPAQMSRPEGFRKVVMEDITKGLQNPRHHTELENIDSFNKLTDFRSKFR